MASKPKRSRGGVMAGIDETVEQQLRQYLDERGWRYRWQDAVGTKVPEATILDDADNPIAVIEATWLPLLTPENKKPDQVGFLERAKQAFEQGEPAYSEVKGMDRIYSLHERLEAKQEQAQAAAAQNLPFMLVMSNDIPFFAFGRDLYNLLEQYPEFSALGRLVERWAVSVARQLHERITLPDETQRLLTIVRDALQERYSYRLRHAQRRLGAFLAEERQTCYPWHTDYGAQHSRDGSGVLHTGANPAGVS
ncbi:MAG: hypothetical protein ABDI19_09625 [Armatimonadota bacterium]